jgi:uncharacterized membrane protein YhaH (DUF805 family)
MAMTSPTFGRQGFWILLSSLCVLALGQGVCLGMLMSISGRVDPSHWAALAHTAWLVLAMLCLTVLVIFWMVVRRWRERIFSGAAAGRTEYMDVWAEAGRRVRVDRPEDPDDDGYEEDEDEDDDQRW